MATFRITQLRKWAVRTVGLLILVIVTFMLAALAGSIIPANQDWKSPARGIQLFIETNGVHTGLILPLQSDVHDWTDLIRPEHLEDPSLFGSHVLIGWGHEGVYRNAMRWKDLRARDAASAIFGSRDVLLHVYHLKYPQAYPHYRRSFEVTEEEYLRIVDAIESRFVLDPQGHSQPSRGYGKDDLFYESRGHYTAFYTCNNWTSDVLRQAGIRTGIWTPFQGGVMRWFPEPS